ncbi:hypothetical protein [uncultured Eudoraea sp.]|uniref:hypothetical protein n=1 Tax=uncultured Eudoraea sp. TaxID=1035614 RepID=UPI002637FE4C|nr:hypothetical protein [uncultured Eudoraea sp.]
MRVKNGGAVYKVPCHGYVGDIDVPNLVGPFDIRISQMAGTFLSSQPQFTYVLSWINVWWPILRKSRRILLWFNL